jgi:hypothetical protein
MFTWSKPVLIPQGDGSVLVKPGKPQAWLTPAEFAAEVGLSVRSIYDYIGTDALPSGFVDYSGARKIRIQAAAIEHWREHFQTLRAGGIAGGKLL